MALLALFKRQEEKNRKAQGKAPVIIDDEDDEDFQGPASLFKAKRNMRGAGAYSKRKRARIQDDSDESEEDVKTLKKPKASNKSTPTKKGGGGGAKKPSTTPTKKEGKKKEIQSISDFFGAAPVKRTTRSTRHDKSGEKSKISKQPIRLGKRQVQDDGGGRGEVSTVPESPTEAILMEFDDEAVALALQEEELEMQKEKEKQIHDDEEFSKTLSALDSPPVPGPSGTKKVQPSPSRPPAKKLKLMMDKLPVSRSPSRTPTSTPTKEKPTRKSPESKAATNAPGKASKKPPQPTTRRGTRGGVRYLGEEEEPTEPTVEKKKAKTPPSASPTKQGSKSNSRKSPVKQGTTPPPGKRQTTPTSTRGKSLAQSPTSTTPKKSTPQSAPPPAAAASSGTTPSLSRAQSFLRYKNRGGPRAPGSKEIPQGAENCLDGLTFVITGVLESLEREEAADIIKKYGGKVTTNVSGKTSYIVVGEEAGESKLAKARQVETKQIDEDGLLDLIRTLPTPGKTAGKKTTPAASSKKTKAKSKSKSPAPPGPTKPSSVKSHDPQPATPTSSRLTSTKSFYGSAPSTSPSVPKPSSEPQNLLWVDKYRPRSTKNVIGQQGDRSNAKKLAHWLQNWDRNHQRGGEKGGAKRPLPWGGGGGGRDDGSSFKAALLSGPPGIGKTTTATLVCEENGYSYVEMNASSTRNKRTLHQEVASQLSCLSLSALIKEGVSGGWRHALIMDEVDGMAGNEDRGGMQELIQMIKTTKIPIICICNDRQSMKIRSLASHCYDLRFQRPKVDQIKGAMMSICFKEGLKIDPQALKEMIIASGQDVRQVMHNLSLWSATNKQMNTEEVQKAAMNAKKNSKMSPFDVVRTVFCPMEGEREFTLNEKSDLFFHDYSLSSLFVQENYINARPHATRGNAVATLRCVAKAADSLCDGDLVEKKIRSSQNWGLLPLQSFYSSVIPGEHMKGFLGRPEFPQWLGQNSKRSKFDKNLQEIQRHTRLATSCSKLEFGLDYLHHLRARLTQPLIARGLDGVADVVSSMEHYDLMRSDWDLVSEMGLFKGKPDHAAQIPSKVKAAFTRSFNKDGHMLHYSVASVSKKATRRSTVDSQSDYAYSDMENEGAVEPELDSESDEELSSNPAIKVRKGSESSQNGTGSKKGKQKMGSQGNGTKKKRTKS